MRFSLLSIFSILSETVFTLSCLELLPPHCRPISLGLQFFSPNKKRRRVPVNLFTISFHFLFITFSQVLKEKYYRYFLIRTGISFKQNVHCGVLSLIILTVWSWTSDRPRYIPANIQDSTPIEGC